MNFSAYANEYRINWFTPYLVGYSICLFFGLIFSATTALKITYTLAALAIPFATGSLVRALGLNRFWVIPSFATAFSFSYFWGFFSFVVATPMAIGFFTFCIYYSQRRLDYKMFAMAAVLSSLLFFAHAMAWAFSMLVAATIIYINNGIKATKDKLFPFAVLLPLVIYWLSTNGASQSTNLEFGNYIGHVVNKFNTEWDIAANQFREVYRKGELSHKAAELLSFAIGRMPKGDFIALTLVLLCWPFMLGATLTRNWKKWLPFLLVVSFFMLVPYWVFDTAYVNTRFGAFLLPLSLFIFEDNKTRNGFKDFGVISFLARCGVGVAITVFILVGNYKLLASFKDNDRDFKVMLDKMEPNKLVFALMFDHGSPLEITIPYMHYGSYYQAEKGGVAVPSFPHDPGAHNVPLRFRGNPWSVTDTWRPDLFNWHVHKGERYDYFLVRSHLLKDELFAASAGKVELVARQGDWLLYKNNKEKSN
jgi:hypothetical protein